MNIKVLSLIKNFSYTLTSNLVSLTISTLVILIVPKLIGVEEYGYWQLYIFYTSYVGFLHFGWNDGIYLRYGGEQYENLNKDLFFSQFIMLFVFQIAIGITVYLISLAYIQGTNKNFIIQMTSIALVFVNVRCMLLYVLQSTNRIKTYARITIFDRVLYALLIIFMLLVGVRDFKLMIIADLAGKSLSLAYAMASCRDMVFRKISDLYFSLNETIENISVGIKLMFANIASMLIIGIIRFGIERTWDVTTFGKVSLTLSISNLMMIFINAIGIILFPVLRRTDKQRLSGIYCAMRDFLMVILLGLLLLYYPLKLAMAIWLPQYAQSLIYMALVFPVFIYEGKMALLINTYLKTLRKEKTMLKLNMVMMLISLIITYISTQIFNSLDFTVFSIIMLLATRSALAENYLSKELNISLIKDTFLEFSLTIVFILSAWFIDSWTTVLVYGLSYIAYLFIKKNEISKTISLIKSITKA